MRGILVNEERKAIDYLVALESALNELGDNEISDTLEDLKNELDRGITLEAWESFKEENE